MGKKDASIAESEAESLGAPTDRTVGSLVVTNRDRLAFETCLELTGTEDDRSRVAYFEINASGIVARGRKLGGRRAAWATEAT